MHAQILVFQIGLLLDWIKVQPEGPEILPSGITFEAAPWMSSILWVTLIVAVYSVSILAQLLVFIQCLKIYILNTQVSGFVEKQKKIRK